MNNNMLIKKANRLFIINTVRYHSPITQDEIVRKTKLSVSTVRNIVNELISENILVKAGYRETDYGRQPILLRINADLYYAIGIDVDIPTIRVVIADLSGREVYSTTYYKDVAISKDEILHLIKEIIHTAIRQSKISYTKFIGIGVGMPGIIDIENGISLSVEKLKDWKNVDIVDILRNEFKMPVYLRNDIDLIAIAEKNNSLDKDMKDFLYVVFKNGIGMAVYLNDVLYKGSMGNAGFIGHMTIDVNGPKCPCGRRGCLELYVYNKVILDEYYKLKGNENEKSLDIIKNDKGEYDYIGFLLNKCFDGDENAKKVVKRTAQYLGIGIANAIKLYDVPEIIISGISHGWNEFIIPFMEASIEDNLSDAVKNRKKIIYKQSDAFLSAVGGCFLVIDFFLEEPLLKLKLS